MKGDQTRIDKFNIVMDLLEAGFTEFCFEHRQYIIERLDEIRHEIKKQHKKIINLKGSGE